jgi:hypothetical protein
VESVGRVAWYALRQPVVVRTGEGDRESPEGVAESGIAGDGLKDVVGIWGTDDGDRYRLIRLLIPASERGGLLGYVAGSGEDDVCSEEEGEDFGDRPDLEGAGRSAMGISRSFEPVVAGYRPASAKVVFSFGDLAKKSTASIVPFACSRLVVNPFQSDSGRARERKVDGRMVGGCR